jgi:hypothetical protein
VAVLYWHNLNATNDGTDRTNYSTDQAGTTPATAGSMLLDDLRFNGTGPGNAANWTIATSGVLDCASLDMTDYTGTVTVGSTAAITVTGDLIIAGAVTGWAGTLVCDRLMDIRSSSNFGVNTSRVQMTLTGGTLRRVAGGAARTLFVDITLSVPTTFNIEGDRVEINGSILGGQSINKIGTREVRFSLVANGRTSDVQSISITAGTLFVFDTANPASIIQGVGGVGGEPSACPITLSGNNAVLRYGCSNSGGVEWGNPLIVAPGIAGAGFLLQGTSNGAGHSCYFPLTLNSDLRIYRGTNVATEVTIFGSADWTGTGTVDPDSGKITGAGRLTVERPNGVAANFDVRLDYQSGARAEHTGGTLITSPTESYWVSCGYRGLTGTISVEFGSGLVEVDRNARFWNAGSTSEIRTITNDILLTGSFTGDSSVPWLNLARVSTNPITVFSGMITVDCPAFRVDTSSGGGNQQHQFTGGVTLLQDTRCIFLGGNGQDLVFASDIAGAFSLSLKALNSGGDIKFSFVQTIPRAYVAESGNGYSVFIDDLTALKSAASIEVLSGGRLWYGIAGETELDGQLLLRQGSIIGFPASGAFLRLNSVGPHEWSAEMADSNSARGTEIRLPTDGTVVEFNPASSPIPTPMWRITGDVDFQTANPSTTSIRPGQNDTGTLPAGVPTMFLERGKTLTIDAPLILSMYRSNGEPTGAAGLATIAGTGRLVFSQPNGWSVPSSYGLAEFDINVSFAGTDPTTAYTVTGFVGLRDIRTESSTVNLTVTFASCEVHGNFYPYTSIAGGVGNTTIRWSGTSLVKGHYYQRQDQSFPSGLHRTEILSGAVLTVEGDFRPCSNIVGGPGVLNSRSMQVFAAGSWTLTLKGNIFFRGAQATVFELFYPLNGTGYAVPGKVILDLADNDINVSDEYSGIVADVEIVNASGLPREVTVSTGAWWFNTTVVSGDDITLNLTQDAYGFNISSTGANNTLIFPSYADTGYSWNWKFSGVPAFGGIDLRGFATVDTSASTFFGIYPESATEWWFDGANFALIDLYSYVMTAPTRFRDDFSAGLLRTRPSLGADIQIEGVLTARDVITSGSAGAPGATLTTTGTLIVTGELDLRIPGSTNPSYDVRILGNVEYRPRGAGMLRILDFGGVAAGIPPLVVRREAAVFPGDEPMYGVSLAVYPLIQGSTLLIRNESATQLLQFILGSDVQFVSVTTEQASTGPVALDFNGQDLRTPIADFHPDLGIVAPAGSSLVMVSTGVPATLRGPLSALPEVQHRATHGLVLLGDLVTAAYLQTFAPVGVFNPAGFDVTASGVVAILEGSIDLVGLVGVRFTADLFTVAGVDMNPAGVWYVDSTQAPVAALMTLGDSDASGSGAQGNATAAVNDGGNINWNFGLSSLVSVSRATLGLGLGLGLTNE